MIKSKAELEKGDFTNDNSIGELDLYHNNDLLNGKCVHAFVGTLVSEREGALAKNSLL